MHVVKLTDPVMQESAEEEHSSSATLEVEENPASSEPKEEAKNCHKTMQATQKRKRKPTKKISDIIQEPIVEKKKNTRIGCTKTDLQAYLDQSNT